MRLQALIARPAMLAACRQRLIRPLRREMGEAYHAHLALLNQLRVGFQCFFNRRSWIVAVRLVKINMVGLQSFERAFHLPHDPCLAQPFALSGNLRAYFGCDHDLVALAAALEPVADDRLALAALMARPPCRVAVRGIDKVQSRGYERIQYVE